MGNWLCKIRPRYARSSMDLSYIAHQTGYTRLNGSWYHLPALFLQADSGDVPLEQILKLFSGINIAWAIKNGMVLILYRPVAILTESKASHSSAGSPGLLSLNAHIGQILSSSSSFLWHPVSKCSQWDPVRNCAMIFRRCLLFVCWMYGSEA